MRRFFRPQQFFFQPNSARPNSARFVFTLPKPLWEDDAKSAYGKFLQYAGREVNDGVKHNAYVSHYFYQHPQTQPVESFTPPAVPEVVTADNVSVDFDKFAALDLTFYCSKITIQNANLAIFRFIFSPKVYHPRELHITSKGGCPKFNFAYRLIVPTLFRSTPALAGPMGFHEHLIDGNNSDASKVINFIANSTYPRRIVLKNCKGQPDIVGIDRDAVDQIFEVKNCKDFVSEKKGKKHSRPGGLF